MWAFLGSLGFVAAGLYIWVRAPVLRAAAVLDWIVFGAFGLVALKRLLRPRPLVVLRPEGIVDQGHVFSPGFVRWELLEPPEMTVSWGQPFLRMRPRDTFAARELVRRLPAHKRWYASRWGLVAIAQAAVGDLSAVAAKIEELRAACPG